MQMLQRCAPDFYLKNAFADGLGLRCFLMASDNILSELSMRRSDKIR